MKVKQEVKQPIYPCDEWLIREEQFKIEDNYRNETVFTLANGYLGTRGTFEEAYPFPIDQGLEGNFINGFYESEEIRYGELTYGVPEKSQTMLNVTNAKEISLFLDGEKLSLLTGSITDYERILDLKKAVLSRSFNWETKSGKKVRIEINRMVSFEEKHVMAVSYGVEALNFDGEAEFLSVLDGEVINHTRDTNPLIDYGPYGRVLSIEEKIMEGDYLALKQRTKNTGLALACGALHEVLGNVCGFEQEEVEYQIKNRYRVRLTRGDSTVLTKYIVYYNSREADDVALLNMTRETAQRVKDKGFLKLVEAQAAFMNRFWENADIRIEGDAALQQGVRFNLFHVLQSAGRDGLTGMAAKGLTGEGYEGHYFWDTEMYGMPFFTSAFPEVSKKLMDFRYGTLEAARKRARVMGHKKGALYPWRTINGEEASAYYPQGTAQYHINADVAYALNQYIRMTGDVAYLEEKGAEIFFETARLWYDLGAFTELRDGRFCICDVTGPDEYTSIVDNNFYTNLMARENLLYACESADYLKNNRPGVWEEISSRIDLKEEEPECWRRAAERMYFPYEEKLGIYGQDDTFLYKKPLDMNQIPEENLPMLLHYHPLYVYRHRVAKQADLLMGLFLAGDKFQLEEKKRNYDFYEKVTLHDSSLSTCIFSIMACEIGYDKDAYDYFTCTSRLDLDDYHKNVHTGIHAANMAGTWMGIVYGFAGMRMKGSQLHFNPKLPKAWKKYSFRVNYNGRLIEVEISRDHTEYRLIKGDPIVIYSGGREVRVSQDEKI